MEGVRVAVVGGGQAGLAASYGLTRAGIEHVVLERGRVGQTWRDRWDSFRLVTPNWTVQLPGHHYDGPEPDGFMPRDEISAYLERYASRFGAPVRESVDVRSVERRNGDFVLDTSAGKLCAERLILATGAYQRPHRPAPASTLPARLLQIDVEGYRDERELPPGRVLVVGSGQSGCQIAEELHDAGRNVVLACGKAPWAPRRIGGRDFMWWAEKTGFLDAAVESLPAPSARLSANVLLTGHRGGADLNLRTLRARGVTLTGRFLGASDREARFAPDLRESVAWGDERRQQLVDLMRKLVAERGLEQPDIPEPEPFDGHCPERVDLADFGAVVFACGFRPDYSAWLPWPAAFDELGFPRQRDGASTVVPGLYFLGVHFLRKRKSSLLVGVGEDAAIVAGLIAAGDRRAVATRAARRGSGQVDVDRGATPTQASA
jgi:putative flavoprotein involved in K+ transport